jgi:predicted transposase/invertase (TIGR01784 family)
VKTTIYHSHDRFFKRSLKEKKIAIDFLKAHLPPDIYSSIDINSLQLTEKSFVIPELKEIHSDIIYKCQINQKSAYLFFLLEHQSTADELMAFRMLHYVVSLSYEHLLQGHKKLPIILPLCIYHGAESPYPYSIDLYDCFEDVEFAQKIAFKPFKLIDLTILSDEEIQQHGLAGLMEMLFKHYRTKNFLSIMRKLIRIELIQDVVSQLNNAYFRDMLNYVINNTQDENDPQAAKLLIQDMLEAFPEKTARKTIMTFAEQLRQEGLQQGLQEGLQQGERRKALMIARNLLKQNIPWPVIQSATGLSEQALLTEEY